MHELSGFFSAVKSAAKGVTRVAAKVTAAPLKIAAKTVSIPTSMAQRVVSKVAPKPVSSLFRAVTNVPTRALSVAAKITPTQIIANKVAAFSKVPPAKRAAFLSPAGRMSARGRPAAITQVRPNYGVMPAASGGIFSRISAAMTSPTAVPPVAAAPASSGGGYPSTQGSASYSAPGDPYAGQGGAYNGPDAEEDDSGAGAYDDGSVSMDQELFPQDDPTADMPDEIFESREESEEGDREDLGDIDYRAALGDLADWKDDLKSFGAQAGKSVASQALTTIGKKIAGGKTAPPPPPPPASMPLGAKIAIGGGLALGAGYLLFGRRRRSAA